MTAEQIRKQALFAASDLPGDNIRDCAFFLQEIAAQFADFNERLDGLMGSMMLLTKALHEMNAELRKADENPPAWWTGGKGS